MRVYALIYSSFIYLLIKRKETHGDEDVAVTMESTLQPGHAVNLHGMSGGDNSEPNERIKNL